MGEYHITAHITDNHSPITHYIICPVCQGRIAFNLKELEERRSKGQSTSVYCAGPGGTQSGGDPRNHYHPGFPPEPIYEFEWIIKEREKMATIEELMGKAKEEIEAEIARLEAETAKAVATVEQSNLVQRLLAAQKAHVEAMANANTAVEAVKTQIT